MLCPEIWDFKAPESTFHIETSDPSNTINSFTYSHLVSVILPDRFKVPETLTNTINSDSDYYKLDKIKLSDLVLINFIDNFVKNGSLYALSVDTRIDCDSCSACVTPSGKLILNLDKTTFQSLGLEGHVSHFHKITSSRYVVTVDLKEQHFRPGKRNYERTKRCLDQLQLNFIISWEPPKKEICPSSVAKYFVDLGYNVALCQAKYTSKTVYEVEVPVIDENYYDIVEWMGLVALDGDLTNHGPDDFINTYEIPEPKGHVGQVKLLVWKGFFTREQIKSLWQALSELKQSSPYDWVAMYVQGFSDSPIGWDTEEHHFYTNGDNSYSFIKSNNLTVSCRQKCTRKRYKNKTK